MLIERESLIETVKAKDMEIINLESRIELKEKEGFILKNSLETALKNQKPPWWDNFLTGVLTGTALIILLQKTGH
ncbi:MAG: hypothetical protein ACM3QX_14935 [Syntrophomonadaceae bacterium]